MGMFPQPPELEARGVLQLLDAMLASKVPAGFMHDYADRFASEGLEETVVPIIKELGRLVMNMSPLADFAAPMEVMKGLMLNKSVAKAAVASEAWLPALTNGRSIEYDTLLGPFFKPSTLPDIFGNGKPPIRHYFADLDGRRNSEVVGMVQSLRSGLAQVQVYLKATVMALLRNQDTRQQMLKWIATAIEMNGGRSKMRVDLMNCATHGFFLNLSSVMLHLCLPFMEPVKDNVWDRIDIGYVYHDKGKLTFGDCETRCASTIEDVKTWASQNSVQEQPSYHFICDCFFMTCRVLHIGFFKSVRDFLDNMKELSRHQHMLSRLESSQHVWSMGSHRQQTERQVEQLKAWISEHKEIHLLYECAIQDDHLLHETLSFCRLMSEWLLRIAKSDNGTDDGDLLFRMLPELFVDDVVELLLFTARVAERLPRVLQDEDLNVFMSFLVELMGRPKLINNPYLRAKMVDVLHHWVPPKGSSLNHPLTKKMAAMFEYHEVGNVLLVEHLLQLYVDIEFTGSNTQFYDKFNIRHHIGEMLQYLWEIPVHRHKWKLLADAEAEGFYLRFVNMLVNDAIYLLDEGMKKLPEVRQTLEAMEDTEAWNRQTPQEQGEREASLRQNEDMLRQDLLLADVHIEMMQYTTIDITRAFLVPEMVDRIATMLNYFLRFLVGPERKQLKVKNPEKYGWSPHKMLSQIMRIYMHLAAADHKGDFATAIARDGRSYSRNLFVEAHSLADRLVLLPPDELDFFSTFMDKVASQVAADAEEDEVLGDNIPDEYLDPIQYTLMQDPVMLPSSKVVLDRATIQRHLLSDPTDPFNRSQLSADMLEPQDELKEEITKWLNNQRKRMKQ
mmetsp:Transcript_6829/g.17454  ORF Transcript_6829/g.17454 Transcript_6829/m.17454 type:complete len:842 (+) Transcript_6829:170-2695(+)